MKKLDGQSYDNVHERIEALKKMFPEAVSEGRLDYDTLMALLGDEFDNDQEKYSFTWKGKLNALRLAQKRSAGTLRPSRGESVDWETTGNLYIEGDNLEVLKLLQRAYLRKVKMIYIDPPYNTGNDFVYEDDFADTIGRYKQVTGQALRANPETAGRYHSNWLNMMYPRLKIAKTLLRDDGVIFISIDDNEVHNLRKLCDEVYGEENFVAHIVWQKKYSVSNDDPGIAPMHDHIIVYQRSEHFHRLLLPRTEKQNERYKNPDNDPRGPWTSGEYVSSKSRVERPTLWYSIKHPKTGEDIWPDENAVWRYSQEKHEQMIVENRLYWGEDHSYKIPRMKRFLAEIKDGVVPSTWWPFIEAGHNDEASKETMELIGKKVFSTPKPTRLLRRILEVSVPNDDSVVLDFFAGSCATAHAVIQRNIEDGGNRKFIMVQLPEGTTEDSEAFKAGYKNICEIGKERIRRAGAKIKQEAGLLSQDLDTGFRVFKLDTSNLKEWDESYVAEDLQTTLEARMEQMLDQFKPDRTSEDILYEVLLKYGYPLTTPLSKVEVSGKTFYVVSDGDVFICLDVGITPEIAEQAAEYTPGAMIFADGCFAHDDDIANTNLVLEKREIEFRWI